MNKKNIKPNNKNVSAPKVLKKTNVNKIENKNNIKNDKKIKVNRHEFNRNIFDANYITNNEEIFNENYCSNFRSNLEKEAFDYLLSLIKGNRVLLSQQKQTTITNDIFNRINQKKILIIFQMKAERLEKSGLQIFIWIKRKHMNV